jgi:hypothetical protein
LLKVARICRFPGEPAEALAFNPQWRSAGTQSLRAALAMAVKRIASASNRRFPLTTLFRHA